MQGWRNTMEDSHIASLNLDRNVQVFGVFDGHGGREVALFVKDVYIRELSKLQSFKNKDYETALRESFIRIDDILKSPQGIKDLKKYKSQDETQSSLFGRPETDNIALYTGCTACVIIIADDMIYCGNSGDSRCVLSNDGTAVDMSIDHKPDMPTEKARIEKAGGFVEDNRVKGVLNLSRSLGDLEYKQDKSISVDNQMITCVPEVKIERISKAHDFIVIACDGIWDCLTSQECIQFVREFLQNSSSKTKISDCTEQMFDRIIAQDVASSGGIGCDNMTAVIIQLKPQ
eukprot:403335568